MKTKRAREMRSIVLAEHAMITAWTRFNNSRLLFKKRIKLIYAEKTEDELNQMILKLGDEK